MGRACRTVLKQDLDTDCARIQLSPSQAKVRDILERLTFLINSVHIRGSKNQGSGVHMLTCMGTGGTGSSDVRLER
jgi:hypothetical protein